MRVLKSMYVMNNYGKLFAYELTEWLFEEGFIQYQCHMYIYYKYAPYGTKNIVLYYVDDCVYCYIILKLLENGLWILSEIYSM